MHEAVIVSTVRTPVGTAFRGSLVEVDPVAMTGSRMVMTLTHELRRRGGGVAVAAMCAGGGMATAVVLEVPAPA